MKHIFTLPLFIIIIELTGCGHTKALNQENSKKFSTLDTATFVIFNKGPKQPSLSLEELSKVENILQQCISDHNLEREKYVAEENKKHPRHKLKGDLYIIDPSYHKRQYVPSINDKGEKEVWVNCFCGHWDSKWKENIVRVEDGGSCFFNVTVNLTTGKYYGLKINGVA